MNPKLLLYLTLACGTAFSQGSSAPPPILRIVSTADEPPRVLQTCAKATVDILGVLASTGAPRTWWIEMHPTFASIEALDQAVGRGTLGGLQEGSHVTIATFEPGWSYLPEEAGRNLPKARYLGVTIYRIRPGAEAGMGGIAQFHKTTAERLNSTRANLVYHVVSGDDAGTFTVLSPLASLSVLDAATVDPEATGGGGAEGDIENGREHYLFRVEPRYSCVSTEFANGDPGFWRP